MTIVKQISLFDIHELMEMDDGHTATRDYNNYRFYYCLGVTRISKL